MVTHSQVVKDQFEAECEEYDQNVRDVLPYYEEMYKKVIEEVNLDKSESLEILDLGIGTGQTTGKLLEKFPNCRITGIDISPKMIEMAKKRQTKFLDRVTFIEGDIINFKPSQKYDACVGVLSVHHLKQKEKQLLFLKIFNSLENNGVFVIGDMIIGDSKKETYKIENDWKKYLTRKFGKKEVENWMNIYRKEDIPDSINNQLQWLKKAGFREVKCSWKKMNCAVFWSRK